MWRVQHHWQHNDCLRLFVLPYNVQLVHVHGWLDN